MRASDPDEDVRRRARELRIESSILRAGVAELRADLERIAGSRAWRWGHASARALARLRRRRPRTEGAVGVALARIAALERAVAPPSATAHRAEPGDRLSFCIKVPAPSLEVAPRWGDQHFATALERELRRRGHRVLVQVLPAWEDPDGDAYDVALVLRGQSRYAPRPAQLNVLWSISHPEALRQAECDGYDLVCVASERAAAALRDRVHPPVLVLEQATDPLRFFPEPGAARAHELLFVGNTRGVRRPILDDLLPTDRGLGVYGAGWAGLVDRRHLIAEHVPNEELRHLYSAAGVVLNDHWDDMRAHGFVSNRVYDAVACGAVVVSDRVDGLEERFAGAVLTYGDRDELRRVLDRLLADPAERAERGAAGRARVLAEHTFAHRVDALLAAVEARRRDLAESG